MIPRYKVLPANGYRKTVRCAACGIFMYIGLVAALRAESVPAADDATLHETQNADISDGAGAHLYVGRLGSNGGESRRRGLVRFDLSASIPPGAQVTGAILRLQMSRSASSAVATVSVHRVLQAWSEGPSAATSGQGAPSQAGDTSWRHAQFPGTLWSTAGGHAVPTPSAVQAVDTVGTYDWTSPALVADVQRWLDRPQENFGWLLIGNEADTRTIKRFDSREHSAPQARPVLEVAFTPPVEVTATLLTAVMRSGDVVPPASGDAMGLARVGYDFMNRTLTVRVQHDLPDGTALTLHGPATAGQTAPVLVALGNTGIITSGSNVISLLEEEYLFEGLCYLQIASDAQPGGALRGQVLADQDYAVHMSAYTPGDASFSLATGVGFMQLETHGLGLTAMHNVSSAPWMQLLGPPDPRGHQNVIAEWPAQDHAGRNRLAAGVSLSPAENAALQAGALRLVLLSSDTNIVASGAWQPVDPDPDPVFSGRLDGGQAIPQAANNLLGAVICGYDAANGSLDYRLTHSVSDIAAGFLIGDAGVGTNGVVVADLTQLTTSLRGALTLGPETQTDLERGHAYFSIHNSTFPGGAIRGQVYRGQGYSATLSGRHVWPRVTTHDRGAAVFMWHDDTHELEYYVVHDVAFADTVFLRSASDTSAPELVLSTLAAPEAWGRVALSHLQWRDLVTGRMHVGVSTVAYPDGKIAAPVRAVGGGHVTTHSASLVQGGTGAETLPPVFSGLVSLDYDCRTGALTYEAVHDLTNTAQLVLLRHAPPQGVTNVPVATLGVGNVIRETALIPPAGATGLGGGDYRVAVVVGSATSAVGRVHSASHYAAVLNARQNEPVAYHDGAGLALCDYDASNRVLHVAIQHSAVEALGGTVRRMLSGSPDGALIQNFSSIDRKAFFTVALDASEVEALQRGEVFLDAFSLLDGSQKIRGWFHRTVPDDDCNEIPNAWEITAGLAPGQYDRALDLDGDGLDVFDEYMLDSHPGVSNVPFRVALSPPSNDVVQVSADGSANRLYVLESRPDLNSGHWRSAPVAWAQYAQSNRVVFSHSNTAVRTFLRVQSIVPLP